MTRSRIAIFATVSLLPLAPAAAQPAAQTVDVRSFSFAPQPIHLRAGRPVTLTFVNHAGGGHDFTAPAFFASSRIVVGAAPRGEIDLRGGETKSITLIPRAGTYKAHCSHFMHTQFGMQDTIIVD